MNWKYLIPIIAILTVGSLYLMMDNADESDAATGAYTDGDWTFNVSGTNATIVSNTATGITALTIPSTVSADGNTYTVTTIGLGGSSTNNAIVANSQLASGCTLTIPDSVTSIGSYAFNGCRGFTGSLTIPDRVTSIGSYAFYNCSGFTGTLTLPSGLTRISGSAFNGCIGFTGSLTIPDSVTVIGMEAFNGCIGFTGSLTIPDSVTVIGMEAFNGCRGFTGTLTLPSGLTSINDSAFYNCRGFTGTLTIPDRVTSIGMNAFYNCRGFTGTLTLPSGLTRISASAFNGCSGLDSLVNLSGATFDTGSLNMAGVTEVLNLGDTELNPGSYGLPSTCTVKTEIDADSYIAPAMIKKSHDKEGAVYTILALLPLFIILGALVVCATTIVRKN